MDIVKKQVKTVHKLNIYIHTFVTFVCDVCLMCADLPLASKNAYGYRDQTSKMILRNCICKIFIFEYFS